MNKVAQLRPRAPREYAYPVQNGVPIPKKCATRKRVCPYPFADMRPLQSFLVPLAEGETAREIAQRIRYSIRWFRTQYPDVRFTVRETTEGVRCWRIQ